MVSDSCDPMGWGPPDSSVHGILQARILEWVAISFYRGGREHGLPAPRRVAELTALLTEVSFVSVFLNNMEGRNWFLKRKKKNLGNIKKKNLICFQ